MNAAACWQALAARGVVQGDAPSSPSAGPPWYLRGLTGFAAWIASWFVLASIGALSWKLLETAPGSMVLGALLCTVAWAILRKGERQTFVEQLALAISFAGQVCIGYGLYIALGPRPLPPLLAMALLEVVMVVVVDHRMHRAMSTLFACAALYAALMFELPRWPLPVAIAALFAASALVADRSARTHAFAEPVSTGLALALCAFAPIAPLVDELGVRHPPWAGAAWLQSVLIALVLCAVVVTLLRRSRLRDRHALAAIGIATVALAASAWPVPGLIAALVVVVVAFAMARPVLVGVGVLSATWMVGYYYYALQATLLTKSLWLAATGLVLLAAGLVVPRLIEDAQARADAVERDGGPRSGVARSGVAHAGSAGSARGPR